MKRKILYIAILLTLLLLCVASSLAEHSKAYENATGLFIAGEYEQAYSAFMELEEKETFEEWVDRFLFECDTKKYEIALSESAWREAAALLLDMEKRCYSQSAVSIEDLIDKLIWLEASRFSTFGCEAFLRDMDAFLKQAESSADSQSSIGYILRRINSVGEKRLDLGDYKSAKKIFIFTADAEDAVGVMIEDLNAREYGKAEAFLAEGKKAEAVEVFEKLWSYRDAASRAKQLRNEMAYDEADGLFAEGKYEESAAAFEALGNYGDSAARVRQIRFEMPYADAEALLKEGKKEEAAVAFEALGDYGDSAFRAKQLRNEIAYMEAETLLIKGEKQEAALAFAKLGDFSDSAARVQQIRYEVPYAEAEALLKEGRMAEAAVAFETLGSYGDSAARAQQIRKEIAYAEAESLLAEGKRLEAAEAFEMLGNFSDAAQRAQELYCELVYELATDALNNRRYEEAAGYFDLIGDYRDAALQAESARNTAAAVDDFRYSGDYNKAVALFDAGEYDKALAMFKNFNGFCDSVNYINRIYYKRAEQLFEQGSLKAAREAFIELGDFRDAAGYVERIDRALESPFLGAKVGDVVKFGRYEQDNDLTNGKEPIEWRVLDVQPGKVLVISEYGLDAMPYNLSIGSFTWNTCTLRKWLNKEFLKDAFGEDEQIHIAISTISTARNPSYGTIAGDDTQDKVFLLSVQEVKKYFSSESKTKCIPTEHAKAKGCYTSFAEIDGEKTCNWWLRTAGLNRYHACTVYANGLIGTAGTKVETRSNAVRPAMWVALTD